MDDMETTELISVQEAAERKGVSVAGIRLAVREGRLPSVKVLGRVGIRVADLEAYEPRSYRGRPGRSVGGRPAQRGEAANPDRYDLVALPAVSGGASAPEWEE